MRRLGQFGTHEHTALDHAGRDHRTRQHRRIFGVDIAERCRQGEGADGREHRFGLEPLDAGVTGILDGGGHALLEVQLDTLIVGSEGREVQLKTPVEQLRLEPDFPSRRLFLVKARRIRQRVRQTRGPTTGLVSLRP